jgi:poly(hydroxyalkanoate) depolymerase family esterase
MLEATRFVQAGRLTEATALLQRLLRGEPGRETMVGDTSDAPTGRTPRIIDVAPETGEVPDHPPAFHPRQAFGTGPEGWSMGGTAGTVQPPLPEALRSLLERVTPAGLKSGLEGLAGPLPVQSPAVVPNGAKFIAGSYGNQAGSRAYKLYVPSGYQGQTLPLVVMLHGCTQSPDDFAAGTRMNALAEERICLVVYPEQAASANAQRCWNWFSPDDQQRDRGEPSLIAGITRQIMRDYPVDPQCVYVAGLSAGGAAAVIMGATYPDLYAAIGVHSGLAYGAASDLPSAFAAMRQGGGAVVERGSSGAPAGGQRRLVPTIVFHGDRDGTVHSCNGDRVIAQARAAAPVGLQPTATVERGQVPGGRAYRRTLHADADGQAILEQWVIHGAGHAWSGGSSAGSYTDPQGPDAAREMLRFFLEHPHSSVRR